MLRPQFDSTLLIAASTCQGMPYAAPARCHSASSSGYESCTSRAGGVESDAGTLSDGFGVRSGSANGVDGTTANVPAPAVPASKPIARMSASGARRRTA